MALREMMEMKETMGGQGMPESLDTMATVRSGGMPPPPPQPQGMMPPVALQQGMMPPAMPPQPMPQAAPAMAMPPSGLASIAPPPVMPEAPESNMILEAVATLNERGKKRTIYEEFQKSARDRGVNLPASFSPEMGGLMRLAAEGGPVLYRREGGVPKGPSREEIIEQMRELNDRYSVQGTGRYHPGGRRDDAYLSYTMGLPLDIANNPFFGEPDDEFNPGIRLYERGTGPGGMRRLHGGQQDFVNQYNSLLAQLNAPEPEPASNNFVPLTDARYGSLNDPNLPAMDAAQQRLQYRQNVGFFEKPPGPTANTRRILSQAYGEESPIRQEILQGLQPRPAQPVSAETAMQAYYGLPGVVYDPEAEVEAQTGGGLKDLAAGGEFSGRVPGDGGGMEDNVRMPIMEGEKQVATLAVSPTEYVVDSYTMAALGNGNPDKGADHMDEVVEDIREEAYGTTEQPNEIDGLALLQANMMG